MYTVPALLDLHDRAHRSLQSLLAHCAQLGAGELNRELPGFGYPTVRLQLHHGISAEEYWIGVLQGRPESDDNEAAFRTIESLAEYRGRIAAATDEYLRRASAEELNTARKMLTWGNKEQVLAPARVIVRTLTHIYHHQGQTLAMCRLLGRPVAAGLDFPIA